MNANTTGVERAEVDLDAVSPGDVLAVKIGDWNGHGYNHHNYSADGEFVVVDATDTEAVAVRKDDRAAWNLAVSGQADLEVTFNADGSIGGLNVAGWGTPVVQDYDVRDGDEYTVAEGRRRRG